MRFTYVLPFIFLCSCGYQWGQGTLGNEYQTISIPYVKGDQDGTLTASIIKNFSTSSDIQYVNCGGDLLLQIEVIDLYDENIGFRYDRKKEGKLARSIIPTETRLNLEVELTLIDASTNRTIKGPVRLQASAEFDHDFYTTRDAVNAFSLGQLTDYDEAYDAAQLPLNQAIAKKIVDYVCQSW